MSNNTYRLRDDGYPTFKKILCGKKWIGRVQRQMDGTYLGVIGNGAMRAFTEIEAFEGITAKHLGYQNASQLKAHNKVVVSRRREAKARARYVVDEMLQGNFEPLEVIVGLPKYKRVNPNDEAR